MVRATVSYKPSLSEKDLSHLRGSLWLDLRSAFNATHVETVYVSGSPRDVSEFDISIQVTADCTPWLLFFWWLIRRRLARSCEFLIPGGLTYRVSITPHIGISLCGKTFVHRNASAKI